MTATRTIHGSMPKTRSCREGACRLWTGQCECPTGQVWGRSLTRMPWREVANGMSDAAIAIAMTPPRCAGTSIRLGSAKYLHGEPTDAANALPETVAHLDDLGISRGMALVRLRPHRRGGS